LFPLHARRAVSTTKKPRNLDEEPSENRENCQNFFRPAQVRLTAELIRTKEIFQAANDQLESRLAIDPAIDADRPAGIPGQNSNGNGHRWLAKSMATMHGPAKIQA
jgi:hypothetical protein